MSIVLSDAELSFLNLVLEDHYHLSDLEPDSKELLDSIRYKVRQALLSGVS